MRLCLPLLALLLAACDASGSDPTIGGAYSGVTEDLGADGRTTVTFDIPTTDSGESFTFQATVVSTSPTGTETETLDGAGVYEHPGVLLTPEGEATLGGTVRDDGDVLDIELEPGERVTFRR